MKKWLFFFLVLTFLVDNNFAQTTDYQTLYAIKSKLVPYRSGELWGYASRIGNVIITPQYDEVGLFRKDRIAWVKKNNRYGYINDDNHIITKLIFEEASDFKNGFATVTKKNKTYRINKFGEKIIYPKGELLYLNPVTSCSDVNMRTSHFETCIIDGKIAIKRRNKYLDVNGRIFYRNDTLANVWDELIENYKGVAAVRKGKKWGIINYKNQLIIPLIYDRISPLFSSLDFNCQYNHFMFSKNRKFGILDEKGNEIIAPIYSRVEPFENGIAKVWTSINQYGYINLSGYEYFKN